MTTPTLENFEKNSEKMPPPQEAPALKYFVRIVWSGEPQENAEDGFIVKETLGTFVEGAPNPLIAIAGVAGKIIEAGAYITEMHYVAAMDVTDGAVEKQIRAVEKILVNTFDKEYVDGCMARSAARVKLAQQAAEHKAAAHREAAEKKVIN